MEENNINNNNTIGKNTPVKIVGMPDVCQPGIDFIEETSLWESYHVMMKHFQDENRFRGYSDWMYQFTVTSEYGILYQYYLNALDISPEVARFVDIDSDADFHSRGDMDSNVEAVFTKAIDQRNSHYSDCPEQKIYKG